METAANVLHVENNTSFAEMSSTYFERIDDIVVDIEGSAADGLAALEDVDYDCVISDYELPGMDGLEFLKTVRETDPDRPFILYTGAGSEDIASESISAGVTDYVLKESDRDHFERLAARVRDAVRQYRSERQDGRERMEREMTANETALRDLYEVTAERHDTFEEKLVDLIAIGCDRFDLPFGYVTEIADGEQRIIATAGDIGVTRGDSCPLEEAYCRKTIVSEDPVVVSHAAEEGWQDDPAYLQFDFECYVGGRIDVDGEAFGTLCLGSRNAAGEFSTLQLRFLDILCQWIGNELRQQRDKRALERQNERLDEFASVLSHDLRNPLQTATGYLGLAREEVDHPSLAHVDEQLERMRVLIDNMLEYARHGTEVDDFEAVDLTRVANAAWRTVDTADATLEVADGLPAVRADGSRLRQLFENLFRNAVEHASPDSRTPRDAVEPGGGVTVRVAPLEDADGIYVADDGPGLPENECEDIFTLGYTTNRDGSGFGLAIVGEIVEAHDWSIEGGTDPDLGGARFEVADVDLVSASNSQTAEP